LQAPKITLILGIVLLALSVVIPAASYEREEGAWEEPREEEAISEERMEEAEELVTYRTEKPLIGPDYESNPPASAYALLQDVRNYYDEGSFVWSLAACEEFDRRYPGDKNRPEVDLVAIRCMLRLGYYQDAINGLDDYLDMKMVKGTDWAAEAIDLYLNLYTSGSEAYYYYDLMYYIYELHDEGYYDYHHPRTDKRRYELLDMAKKIYRDLMKRSGVAARLHYADRLVQDYMLMYDYLDLAPKNETAVEEFRNRLDYIEMVAELEMSQQMVSLIEYLKGELYFDYYAPTEEEWASTLEEDYYEYQQRRQIELAEGIWKELVSTGAELPGGAMALLSLTNLDVGYNNDPVSARERLEYLMEEMGMTGDWRDYYQEIIDELQEPSLGILSSSADFYDSPQVSLELVVKVHGEVNFTLYPVDPNKVNEIFEEFGAVDMPGSKAEARKEKEVITPEMLVELKGIPKDVEELDGVEEAIREWTLTTNASPDGTPKVVNVTLGDLSAGLYIVEASASDDITRSLLMVSPVIVMSGADDRSMLIQAIDARNGESIKIEDSNLYRYWWDYDDEGYSEQRSEKVKFPAKKQKDGWMINMDKLDRDSSYFLVLETEVGPALFNFYPYYYRERDDYQVGIIYTDRPLYRPQDLVSFKGVVREVDYVEKVLSPIKDKTVLVTLYSPDYEEMWTEEFATNEFGSFWGEVELPAGTMLGYLELTAEWVDESEYDFYAYTYFQLEEYEKPEYEMTVLPQKDRYLSGEEVNVEVVGYYYFGAPMSDSYVEYEVTRSGYYTSDWDYEYDKLKKKGDGYTDSEGRFLITFDSDYAREFDNTYEIYVKLTDPSNHVIEDWMWVYTYRSDRYVGLYLDQYTYHEGDTIEATVYTYDWYNEYLSMPVTVNVYEREYDQMTYSYRDVGIIYTTEVTTGDDGYATVMIDLVHPPQYVLVEAVIEDTWGTEVTSVYDAEFVPRTIVTEETAPELAVYLDEYYPELGDVVTLTIESRFDHADVFLIYLSNYIVESEIVELEPQERGSKLDIVLDVGQKFLPYTEIYARLVKDDYIYYDYQYLYVTNTNTEMNITVEAGAEEYTSGEEAEVTVTCTDNNDRPVKAELSLVAIDNSLLALAPDETYYLPDSLSNNLGRDVWLEQEDNFYYRGTLDTVVFYFQYFYPFSSSGAYHLPIPQDWDVAGDMLYEIYPSYYIRSDLYDIIYLSGTDMLSYIGVEGGREKLVSEVFGYGGGEKGGGGYFADEMALGSAGYEEGEMVAELETLARKEEYPISAPGEDYRADKDYIATDRVSTITIEGKEFTQAVLRQYFTDSPLWIPDLETGGDGKAFATVNVPDNLTTWKLFALGVDKGQRIGWGEASFVSTKNVIIRLKAPRHMVVGDVCKLTAIAHNYLPTSKDIRISIDLEGLSHVGGDQSKTIKVAPDDKGIMEEWVRADEVGDAYMLSAALTDEESDAAEKFIPIFPHGAMLRQAFAGRLRDSVTHTLTLADMIDPKTFSGELILSPSLAAALSYGLDFFTVYPYDCIEQTINRFLPNAVLAGSAGKLGLDQYQLSEGLAEAIDDGIARIYEAQTDKGGWAWWKGGKESPYMTAYAVDALYTIMDSPFLSEESMVKVDEMYPMALEFLEGWLVELSNDQTRYDWELGLYVADVALRVGISDEYLPLIRDSVDYYFEVRDPMSDMGLVLLGSALHQLGNDYEVGVVLRNLDNTANYGSDDTLWWGKDPQHCWYWWDDSVETTAKVLSFKMKVSPDSKQIPFMIDWLVDQRRGAVWKSTKDSSAAMRAIIDYLLNYPEISAPIIADYVLNDEKVGGLELDPTDYQHPAREIIFQLEDFITGDNTLTVERTSGEGPVFYTIALEYYTTADYIPAVEGSIGLERNYYLIDRHYEKGKLVEERKPFEGEIEVGEELEVEIIINSPYDFDYVILEDPRPAGLIFTQIESYYDWWLDAYVELRTEKRAVLFERLNAGETKIIYRLRAEVPGTYSALPTIIIGMYSPDIGSSTAELKVEVVE